MNALYLDADVTDDVRRARLYDGQLFVYTPRDSTRALCEFAQELCREAFAPYDPRDAQFHLSVERCVEILAELKPRFIHHPTSKELIRAILSDLGADLEKTYFDVPRLRSVTSDGYLTSGLGYAFKPHRDSWYSTPMCQLNWWLPVYPLESSNAMAFHPHYWDHPVKNSSRDFNYQEWNHGGRKQAVSQVTADTRKQSEAEEPLELDPQLRIVCDVGGLIVFSAAHMHSTVPNTSGQTRFSIDFRTVHLDELDGNKGARNVDGASTGTTVGDYLRGSDASHVPEHIAAQYRGEPELIANAG